MLKKIALMILGIALLSGCADGFKGYFKKSANNKWIDTKGLQGGKRKPLYNKKYINLAKRNVLEENYDEDDEQPELEDLYESTSPTRINRQMYQNMLKADVRRAQRKRLAEYKARGIREDTGDMDEYPDLIRSNDRVTKVEYEDNRELQKELSEIKSMLSEAKRDLTKYKCPLEETKTPLRQPAKKPATGAKATSGKDNANLKGEHLSGNEDYKQIDSIITAPLSSDLNSL